MDMEHIKSDFYLLWKHGFGTEEKQCNSGTEIDQINGINV
jgi:hypothetical protein